MTVLIPILALVFGVGVGLAFGVPMGQDHERSNFLGSCDNGHHRRGKLLRTVQIYPNAKERVPVWVTRVYTCRRCGQAFAAQETESVEEYKDRMAQLDIAEAGGGA